MTLQDDVLARYRRRYERVFASELATEVYLFIDEDDREWTPHGAVVDEFADEHETDAIIGALRSVCQTHSVRRTNFGPQFDEYDSKVAYKSEDAPEGLEQYEPSRESIK